MTDEQRRAEARFATATGGGAARPPGQPDLEVDVADDDGADGAVAVPRDGQVNGGRSRQEREARFELAVDASEALKLVPEVRRVRKVQEEKWKAWVEAEAPRLRAIPEIQRLPNLPSGALNPWPRDGPHHLVLARYLLHLHDTGKGTLGNLRPGHQTIRAYERTLRSVMLDTCPWSSRDARQRFFQVVDLRGSKCARPSPSCMVLVRLLGPEFTRARIRRENLTAHDVDVALLELLLCAQWSALMCRGAIGLFAVSGRRPCSVGAESKARAKLLQTLKAAGTKKHPYARAKVPRPCCCVAHMCVCVRVCM